MGRTRKEELVSDAVAVIAEKGFVATTMDDVAQRAGVTKRTLYKHVRSKEALLAEIHRRFIDEGLARWRTARPAEGTPPLQLARFVAGHIETVEAHQQAITVFFEEMKHLSAEVREEIVSGRDAYERVLLEILERGLASGHFRPDLDPKVTAMVILGGLNETYRWYRPGGRLSVAALAEVISTSILQGIARRDEPVEDQACCR